MSEQPEMTAEQCLNTLFDLKILNPSLSVRYDQIAARIERDQERIAWMDQKIDQLEQTAVDLEDQPRQLQSRIAELEKALDAAPAPWLKTKFVITRARST